jgi:hypothetical protein
LNGDGLKALEVYHCLLVHSTLKPVEQTYSIILNACSHSLLVKQAEFIFDSIPINRRNVFIYATMVNKILFFLNKSELFPQRFMLYVVL